MSLPNLWVAKTVENPRPNTAHSFYQLAYFQREHDTEHLYIPAQRIRELMLDCVQEEANARGKDDNIANCFRMFRLQLRELMEGE